MTDKELARYIGFKIKEYRKQHSWTQEELGKLVGIGKSTVANYEKGIRSPRQKLLLKIAEVLNVSIDDIFPSTENEPTSETKRILDNIFDKLNEQHQRIVISFAQNQLKEQESKINEPTIEYVTRPVVALLSAGGGEWQESDDLGLELTIPVNDNIPDTEVGKVVGNSMSPKFKDNDYVFIDTKTPVEFDQIGVFRINGKNYIKRLQHDNQGKPYLESLNPDYDDIYVKSEDDDCVLGVVIGKYRKS